MWREISAVNGSVAYFRPLGCKGRDNEVFAHTFAKNQWSELPKCPNSDFSLAVINSFVTAIGGETENHELTNFLLSLNDKKWTKLFPPMPTKHWLTAVVCSGKTLVVAGGKGQGDKRLSTVEVMDTKTIQWSTARSLPHPLYQASQHSVETSFTCWEVLIQATKDQSHYSPAHWLPSSSLASHIPWKND